MGWLNPKNPFVPADAPKPSRRERQANEDNRLIAFCAASTAHQKAIATHGRDSLQAGRTRQAMGDAQLH